MHNVFDGYCKTEPTFSKYADNLVESLFSVLNDRSLPYEQMQQKLAVMKSRIKPKILNQLNEFLEVCVDDFPVKKVRKAIEVSKICFDVYILILSLFYLLLDKLIHNLSKNWSCLRISPENIFEILELASRII